MLKSAFIALLTAALFLPARAQVVGTISPLLPTGNGFPGAAISPGQFHGVFPRRPYTGFRRASSPNLLLAFPGDYADYSSGPALETQPQVVVLQAAPAPAPQAAPSSKAEPLILELRGDHYVQVSGPPTEKDETVTTLDQADLLVPKTAGKTTKASRPQLLPPVTLVYRDGHREQVRGYTIIDGILYAQGDYWNDGYWTKKIQLSALNLPATQTTNQKRGVNFMLPTSPNEVVTRP